jgi:hypothetical protein
MPIVLSQSGIVSSDLKHPRSSWLMIEVNTYSGRPGYSSTLTANPNTVTWGDLPDATYTTPTPTVTLAPLASGVRSDCARYFSGSDFPEGIKLPVNSLSACERAASVYNVSPFDLGNWNVGEFAVCIYG